MGEFPPGSAGPDDRGDPLDGVHVLSDEGERGGVCRKGEEDRYVRGLREV